MTELTGRTLGHYRIVEQIGKGGMGVVYRAHDERLDRDVAIKVLPEGVVQDGERLSRFEREAKAVAKLAHPNILAIHDFGTQDGVAYAVMELLDGESLRDVLKRGLTPGKSVEYAQAIAGGLASAHSKGIVHRDLKPENVFLTRDGQIKILDFGLAKLMQTEDLVTEAPTATLETTPGALLGTVGYMAPEQVQGQEVDHRCDIFALGVVLYEMVAGRRPFGGATAMETLTAILQKDPEPIANVVPDAPPSVAKVVAKCLEKRPEDRFSSAHDLSLTLGTVDSTASVPRPDGDSPLGKRWPHILAVAIAVVIALLVIFPPEALFDRRPDEPSGPLIRSIAVLPLENLSGDPEQEFFADGMTDALTAVLAKIGALKVISRTSVMRYKGTTTPLPEIAAELGVDAVIEGSVMRAGDRVRITAQLIEAATDQHLWAENYERDLTDILALQGEVARAIAHEIQIALTPQEESRLAKASPVNPKAYEAYLLGQYHLKKETIEGGRAALQHFENAISIDPENALAYAGLAEAYSTWGKLFLPPGEAEARAEAAARKALDLDDSLAEAHLAFGYFKLFMQWDWDGAGMALKRALELNPGLAEAHHNYAHYLWVMGRTDEGEAESRRYAELEPQWPRPSECLGHHLWMNGQPERAIESFERALKIDPTYYYGHLGLGDTNVQLGLLEEATACYRAALPLSDDPYSQASLGLCYVEAVSGNGTEAEEILRQLEADGAGLSSTYVAGIHAALGHDDEAFEWLEKAYREKDMWVFFIRMHPWLDPLRDDPRFSDIVRRMNFPEN